MNNVLKLASVLAVVGCSKTPEEDPFEGPGWDAATGLLEPQEEYLVGITHLRVKNLPGPGKKFGDHAEAVATWLFENEPEGWVGVSFRNIGRLDWWTLTVWESEDAQMAFLVSEAHAAAMLDLETVSKGAESRSLWVGADEVAPSWDTALEWLAETRDFTYGEL